MYQQDLIVIRLCDYAYRINECVCLHGNFAGSYAAELCHHCNQIAVPMMPQIDIRLIASDFDMLQAYKI